MRGAPSLADHAPLSVNDFVDLGFDLQMRDFELRHNLEGGRQRFIGLVAALFIAERPT